MIGNFTADTSGRLQSVTSYPLDETQPVVEIPDGATASDYRMADGVAVYDPAPQTSEKKMAELKKHLSDTDYAVIKIAEGAATREEYADIIAQRELWREQIRELEDDNS